MQTLIRTGLLAATVLLLATAANATAPEVRLMLDAGTSLEDAQRLLALPNGARVTLANLPLGEGLAGQSDLALQRVDVFAADASIEVHDENGIRKLRPPNRAHFTGSIEDVEGSQAFMSLDEHGTMRGVIHRDDDIFVVEISPDSAGAAGATISRKVQAATDFAGRSFSCEVQKGFAKPLLGADHAKTLSLLSRKSGRSTADAPLPPSAGQRVADIIIETDYEFYQKFGSVSAATNYVSDLFAYIGVVYRDQINTRLSLKQIVIYDTVSDPWAATTAGAALDELGNRWNTAPRDSVSRHHVHFMSGKSMGGIAWLNSLCDPYYGYGVTGSIAGNFSAANPQIVWDAVGVAHELGHGFGADHTHSFDDPYIGTGGSPVDCCYVEESQSQCYVETGQFGSTGLLPGINSLRGGVSGQRNGIIMSYCHLNGGSLGNIAMSFGLAHPYGIQPERVANIMSERAAICLPLDPTGGSTFSLNVGRIGSGTVTSNPAGINCGSTCSASFDSGTNVTLSATPSSGWNFSGWSGACTGTGTCSLAMSAAREVIATFSEAPPPALTRDTPITAISGASGSERRYTLSVPSGATNLRISTSGGTGDVDLYTLYALQPTTSNADCSSARAGNAEQCTFPSPAAGTHHILLYGWSTYSGVTLSASYDMPGNCPYTDNLTVQNTSFSGTTTRGACRTLTAGPGVTVTASANVQFVAGERITLQPGVVIQSGGRFTATISSQLSQ